MRATGWYRAPAKLGERWPGSCSYARCAAAVRCRTAANVRSAPWLRRGCGTTRGLSSSSRSLPLKLSTKRFCQRLPGAMNAGPIATSRSQHITLAAVNAKPLSVRTNAGLPRGTSTATGCQNAAAAAKTRNVQAECTRSRMGTPLNASHAAMRRYPKRGTGPASFS